MISNKGKFSWKIFIFIIILLFIGLVVLAFFGPGQQARFSQDVECNTLANNGNSDENIDIVFLPDNYANQEKFERDASKYAEQLLNVVPFNEYKNKFNFYYIFGTFDMACKHDEAILCDPKKVKKISVNCPNDYTIVLTDYNGVTNLFKYLRSSSWMQVACLNTADDLLVFAHEFGHLFADFADEYEFEGGDINWNAPNCVKPDCSAFNIIANPGCFLGCTNNEYFRECSVCIMRDYWQGKTYGKFNEEYIRSLFTKSNPITGNVVSNVKESVYLVNLKIDNKEVKVESVEEVQGYSPDYNYKKTGWSLKINNNQYFFGDPLKAFVDGFDAENNKVTGGTVNMEGQEFSVVVKGNSGQEVKLINPSGSEEGSFNLPPGNQIIHDISKQIITIP